MAIAVLLSLTIMVMAILLIIHKIRLSQAIAGLLLLVYLLLVFGTTVLTRMPGKRRYQLELFWSWKEIIDPIGRTGSVTQNGLLLENLLNMVLLFPAGLLLAAVFNRRLKWYQGLLFGLAVSCVIEVSQLISCRGLFEFDDIIHNGLGCMVGTLVGNIWKWKSR